MNLPFWNAGPTLPIALTDATMIETSQSGLSIVGGYSYELGYLDTIYDLDLVTMEWRERSQKLANGRARFVGVTVANDLAGCGSA